MLPRLLEVIGSSVEFDDLGGQALLGGGERYQAFLWFNPFTHLVRSYRNCLLDGLPPDWTGLAYFFLCGVVAFVFGYWWFARTRKNFADVI